MATAPLDDELWKLIQPLLPLRSVGCTTARRLAVRNTRPTDLKSLSCPLFLDAVHELSGGKMPIAIPEDVRAMLKDKNFWHLATVGPRGAPQSTPIWADTDGTHVIVNSALGRAKVRNMRADGRVALSSFDFSNPYGFVEIQGRVVDVIEGQPAEDGIDDLSEKYLGERPYPYRKPDEQRIIFKVEPTSIVTWERDA